MHSPWWRGKEQSRASLFLISIGLGVLLCGFFSQSCMHEEIPLESFACQKFELCCVLLAEESMPHFMSMQLSWKTGKDVVAVGGKFEWQKEERVGLPYFLLFHFHVCKYVSSIRSGRKINQ